MKLLLYAQDIRRAREEKALEFHLGNLVRWAQSNLGNEFNVKPGIFFFEYRMDKNNGKCGSKFEELLKESRSTPYLLAHLHLYLLVCVDSKTNKCIL